MDGWPMFILLDIRNKMLFIYFLVVCWRSDACPRPDIPRTIFEGDVSVIGIPTKVNCLTSMESRFHPVHLVYYGLSLKANVVLSADGDMALCIHFRKKISFRGAILCGPIWDYAGPIGRSRVPVIVRPAANYKIFHCSLASLPTRTYFTYLIGSSWLRMLQPLDALLNFDQPTTMKMG